MDYTIKAKPTTHNGRTMRSRLEARWAKFFDLAGWRYEYEPYDLDGWTPDFEIYGKKQSVLVEVKPFASLDEFAGVIEKTTQCCAACGVEKDILLLGSTLLIGDNNTYTKEPDGLGYLGEYVEQAGWTFGGCMIFENGGVLGFGHDLMSFHDRIGGKHYKENGWPEDGHVHSLWTVAGNFVQRHYR